MLSEGDLLLNSAAVRWFMVAGSYRTCLFFWSWRRYFKRSILILNGDSEMVWVTK